jgi:glycosidase
MRYFILLLLSIINYLSTMAQQKTTDKITIYQAYTRLFLNPKKANKPNGSIEENGCTRFPDINEKALKSIKDLGISHIWYTGVIRHATLSPNVGSGLKTEHPLVVKGIAGSPYAITDYYDVNPYLAQNPKKRLDEFKSLIARSHKTGLKVLIDFVPNHVARQYKSVKKPKGIKDFGEEDNTEIAFSPHNNFYYLPGQDLKLDSSIKALVPIKSPYLESPAKVSGNDVFYPSPNINDWYETVKLNYGVDYLDNRKTHFEPFPNTWIKMKNILSYWAGMGVDGFRCDMAEMVPAAFWGWVIPEIKKSYPNVIFIAEIYNPADYSKYLFEGKFDYLYDKVGLYDALRRLIEGHGNAMDITKVWQTESGEFSNRMLRFLENHDEQRIASRFFGNSAASAFPAFVLSATLHTGPVMLYYGQEFGVIPKQAEGFSGDDGRTTMFDFWAVEEMQNWIKGDFSTKKLSAQEKEIYTFYKKILTWVSKDEVIKTGSFHDLQYLNQNAEYKPASTYSFLRYTKNKIYLLVFNFDKTNTLNAPIQLPASVFENKKPQLNHWLAKSIENKNNTIKIENNLKININLSSNSYAVYEIL